MTYEDYIKRWETLFLGKKDVTMTVTRFEQVLEVSCPKMSVENWMGATNKYNSLPDGNNEKFWLGVLLLV